MKVCFITIEYGGSGGIGISAKRIVEGLIKKRVEVEVVLPDHNKLLFNDKSYMVSKGNIHKIGPTSRTLSFYSPYETQNFIHYIRELHKKHDFDVFHGFCFSPSGFLAVYMAKLLNKKSIVSIRGNDIARNIFDMCHFSFIKWIIENCNLLTSNAGDLIEICDIFFNCKDKMMLFHNSIDTSEFYHSDKIKLDLKGTIIGTIGIIRQKKGFLYLLDAFKKLLEKKDATFLLIGDFIADEKEFYLNKIKQLGLKSNMIITGEIDHKFILNYVNMLDIYVIASLTEGCPNALLEVMYCKKPVIVTNVGGMREIIKHKENGLLIEPRSSEEIYDGIVEILKDKTLRDKISINAYNTIKRDFNLNKEIKEWLKTYEKCLKK